MFCSVALVDDQRKHASMFFLLPFCQLYLIYIDLIERNAVVGPFGICRTSEMQQSILICASKVSHLFSLNFKQ